MISYIADTHALAWYLTDSPQLGKNAKLIFEAVEKGEATIVIPTIVLAELLYIIEKKRVDVDFLAVIERIKIGKNYLSVPLTLNVIEEIAEIHNVPELHDRIIAATAKILHSKVLAKDPHIKNAVEVVW